MRSSSCLFSNTFGNKKPGRKFPRVLSLLKFRTALQYFTTPFIRLKPVFYLNELLHTQYFSFHENGSKRVYYVYNFSFFNEIHPDNFRYNSDRPAV
jgi:hypothetical protein